MPLAETACFPWLRHLDWDSTHFGADVAEITSPDLTEEQLAEALSAARRAHYRVVYWATHTGRTLARQFNEFCATPVNHRVQFSVNLQAVPANQDARPSANGFRIAVFPQGPANQALENLSILAGTHSRFRVDPRIPTDGFRSLYRIWANRSTLHELADVVLVATPSNSISLDEVIGFITVAQTASSGQIGLIAVHPDHQGQGIASRLMAAAHDWLRDRGVTEVSVVTQLENRDACRLYSRWNYEPVETQQWFHFWL